MKTIRLVEWFGGIGAATTALLRQYREVEVVDYVELDKHAVRSYNAIHDTNFAPTDIKNVDVNGYGEVDLLVAGWPCQDLSVAGKQLGMVNGDRSSLIYLTIEKIKEMTIKPKHILLENVKGLLAERNREDMQNVMNAFKELGYNYDVALLNAKHFGIPQNRERVYIVLTRNDLPAKNIKKLEKTTWGTEFNTLKDILDFSIRTHRIELDPSMDKKGFVYFRNYMDQYHGKIIKLDLDKLNNQSAGEINKVAVLGTLENEEFIDHTFNQKKDFLGVNGIAKCLRAGDCDSENKIIFKEVSFQQDKTFVGVGGATNTLIATAPDFKNKIIFRTSDFGSKDRFNGVRGIAGTITASEANRTNILYERDVIHYRKLHAKECLMLMGFTNMDYVEMAQAGVSDSQICKQAGNSIVVNVLLSIFREVFHE